MRNLVIILDPAHGYDTPGKRSPDGKHREYKWSRDVIRKLKPRLESEGFEVHLSTEAKYEPGISVRRWFAENLKVKPGKEKFLLSIHNDAKGTGDKWETARGVSVWTTPGYTKSDVYADTILTGIGKAFQDVECFPPLREYKRGVPGERDFEARFGVLMGRGYYATLLEFLFQDNKEDVHLLGQTAVQDRLIESLVSSLLIMDLKV